MKRSCLVIVVLWSHTSIRSWNWVASSESSSGWGFEVRCKIPTWKPVAERCLCQRSKWSKSSDFFGFIPLHLLELSSQDILQIWRFVTFFSFHFHVFCTHIYFYATWSKSFGFKRSLFPSARKFRRGKKLSKVQNGKPSGRKEHTFLLIGNSSHLLKRRCQNLVVVKGSYSCLASTVVHSCQMALMVQNKSISVFLSW